MIHSSRNLARSSDTLILRVAEELKSWGTEAGELKLPQVYPAAGTHISTSQQFISDYNPRPGVLWRRKSNAKISSPYQFHDLLKYIYREKDCPPR